jgi:hypothetical protein
VNKTTGNNTATDAAVAADDEHDSKEEITKATEALKAQGVAPGVARKFAQADPRLAVIAAAWYAPLQGVTPGLLVATLKDPAGQGFTRVRGVWQAPSKPAGDDAQAAEWRRAQTQKLLEEMQRQKEEAERNPADTSARPLGRAARGQSCRA